MLGLSIDHVGSRDSNYNMIRVLANQQLGFNVCHINAQSLLPKLDEFRLLFECSGIDAICISETWFNPHINDNIYKLNGYRIYRSDRVSNGGGVAIYIRDNIASKLIYSYNEPGDIELVFIEVNFDGNKMLLGSVYRPNRYIKLDTLVEKLEFFLPLTLKSLYQEILIAIC